MNMIRIVGISVVLSFVVFLLGNWFGSNSSKPDIVDFWKSGRVSCLTLHNSSELAEIVRDPKLANRVREINVIGDARGYSQSLGKCKKLEKVCLSFTTNTSDFLKVLQPGVKSLTLAGTDFWHSPTEGKAWNADLNDILNEQFQSIANLETLEELVVGPWDERLTTTACERLPRLKLLKKLKIEWAEPASIEKLQAALPNCRVILETEQ